MKKNKKKLISTKLVIILFLIFLIIFNFFRSYKFFNIKYITNKFDYKKYEKRYFHSQWFIPNSKEPIGDDILYTYSGVKYIQGVDPSLINPEHPPLGKNLIGFFALYLKNEYFFSIFSGIIAIFSFYLLSNKIIKNFIFSFLLTLIIGFEPLFVVNYFSTNLDLLIFSFFKFLFLFFT